MFYYTVQSSHWPRDLEFKSTIKLTEGQCFRITKHDSFKSYPTRFKVTKVSDSPSYSGDIVEIQDVDTNVEPF